MTIRRNTIRQNTSSPNTSQRLAARLGLAGAILGMLAGLTQMAVGTRSCSPSQRFCASRPLDNSGICPARC